MSLNYKWVVGAALLLAGIAASVLLLQRGSAVDVVLVTQGPMLQSVVTSGRISSVARIDLASQSSARIDAILVREGDAVQAGQVLLRLRDDEARASLALARAQVAQARAQLRQLDSVGAPVSAQQRMQAQVAQAQAAQELVRARELFAQGFFSQARLDEAQRAAQSSQAALLAATAQAISFQTDGAEAALAQSRLTQALAAEQAAAARLDQLSLRAPQAATVISRLAEPGDTAQPGRVLLTLVGGRETRVQASVDEKNLAYLQLGQTARATADAYPDRPFDAKLTFIAPAVDALRGTVELKLRVDQPPAFLRPDMTVSVEIISARVPDALMLPSDAVRRDAKGGAYALVNRNGRAERASLTLGLRGIGSTQVVTGLSAGERVITPTSSVEEGDRVRERSARAVPGNVPLMPGFTQ